MSILLFIFGLADGRSGETDGFIIENSSTMETNEVLREQIFEIINNQLKDNNPPETKATYKRLRKEGFTDSETKQMLGQCIAIELFEVIKFDKPFDVHRYIKNLKGLPKEPFDD